LIISFRLGAIEDIKRLKARYFRCVDTKDWVGLATVFTPDVSFDRTTGWTVRDPWTYEWTPPLSKEPLIVAGREAVMKMIRDGIENIHTVHHGFMPEIDILTENSAVGIWAMCDELRDKDRRLIVRGNGHYHETYERLETGWAIKTAKLTRLTLEYGEARKES
jgi:hypothetical protein